LSSAEDFKRRKNMGGGNSKTSKRTVTRKQGNTKVTVTREEKVTRGKGGKRQRKITVRRKIERK